MKSQSFRLEVGGRIDRARPLRFSFNGRTIHGFAGDTVASALLANGVRLVGRSFKYHRPRGILSHGSDEPNALLSIGRGAGRTDPNNRATVVEATEGMVARSQNHWPSLSCDVGAVNDVLSPLFTAGFYYKTFMWPRALWDRLYEPTIRAAAGLGRAPATADPDRYAHRHAHCDVLVVGAGPAGLAAALAASENDRRVILADEHAELGGSLLHERTSKIDGEGADAWVARACATLASRPNVLLLRRTTAFGHYNHNHLGLVERVTDHLETPSAAQPRERLWQVRARKVLVATGAHERPLVFPDNDRPGVMLAESLRVYVNRYGVAPGRDVVIVTNGASAYRVAADVKAAGVAVTLVDSRPETACGGELGWLRELGVSVLTSHEPLGCYGRKAVDTLVVAPTDGHAPPQGLRCDCVGMSGGWTPAVHLFSQARGKLRFEPSADAFLPVASDATAPVVCIGAANGAFDLERCLAEGARIGAGAVGRASTRTWDVSPPTPCGFQPVGAGADGAKIRSRAFVDFQNDVTTKDIRLAVREGFQSIEHVKRYTTTGMATDQGKTSNMTAIRMVSDLLGKTPPEVGTTTFRPPYTPVTFGALAGPARGRTFLPIRKAPLHDWAVARRARFEDVGLWRRAWYFPLKGETMREAVNRECRAVRNGVGIFDASTLGKIEVVGPDAAKFMNRIYVNGWTKLEPGRCRYGLMLKEDGYVLDDGVVARMAEDRFHVTTTTGGAPRVLAHMEDYLQTEWPNLKVYLTSTTEQWAVIALQGPKARDVLAPLVRGVDLSPDVFPHMSVREGLICGVPTRLFRVSFTGELGYEINVATDYARAVWEELLQRGHRYGITPYGTEAMHVLRAERGFVIIGQETDGTVTPDDLGLGGMIAKGKGDFVGKRSLARPDLMAPGRKQLVGLLTGAPGLLLEEGAQIVGDPRQSIPMAVLGHVTSSYWSEACQRPIALALVSGGRAMKGASVHVTTPGGFAPAIVGDPVFFDPDQERVHG